MTLTYLDNDVTMSIAAIQGAILGYHDNLAILSNLVDVLFPLAQNTMIFRLRDAHKLKENSKTCSTKKQAGFDIRLRMLFSNIRISLTTPSYLAIVHTRRHYPLMIVLLQCWLNSKTLS